MKKIFFVLLAITFTSSLCFAMESPPPSPVSKPTSLVVKTKTFTGRVDSVLIGDAKKGEKSEIVVVDEKGQKLTFIVSLTLTVIGKKGNMSKLYQLSEINKGDKIIVKYITNIERINEAKYIEVVE